MSIVRDTVMNNKNKATNICFGCGEIGAMNYLWEIVNGQKDVFLFCQNCFDARMRETKVSVPNLREACCYYCGDNATVGTINQKWEVEIRGCEYHFACLKCSKNFCNLIKNAFSEVEKKTSSEQLKITIKIVKDVDSQVRALANLN